MLAAGVFVDSLVSEDVRSENTLENRKLFLWTAHIEQFQKKWSTTKRDKNHQLPIFTWCSIITSIMFPSFCSPGHVKSPGCIRTWTCWATSLTITTSYWCKTSSVMGDGDGEKLGGYNIILSAGCYKFVDKFHEFSPEIGFATYFGGWCYKHIHQDLVCWWFGTCFFFWMFGFSSSKLTRGGEKPPASCGYLRINLAMTWGWFMTGLPKITAKFRTYLPSLSSIYVKKIPNIWPSCTILNHCKYLGIVSKLLYYIGQCVNHCSNMC